MRVFARQKSTFFLKITKKEGLKRAIKTNLAIFFIRPGKDFTMMSFLFKSGYPGHREVRFAQMLLLHRSDLELQSMKKHCLEDMPTVIVRMSSAAQIKVEREFVWWNREVLSEFLKEVASDVTSIFFDFAVAFYLSEACHSKIKLPPQDAPQQFKHFVDLINFHFSNPPAFNVEKKMETAIAKEIFAEEKPFLFKVIRDLNS